MDNSKRQSIRAWVLGVVDKDSAPADQFGMYLYPLCLLSALTDTPLYRQADSETCRCERRKSDESHFSGTFIRAPTSPQNETRPVRIQGGKDSIQQEEETGEKKQRQHAHRKLPCRQCAQGPLDCKDHPSQHQNDLSDHSLRALASSECRLVSKRQGFVSCQAGRL